MLKRVVWEWNILILWPMVIFRIGNSKKSNISRNQHSLFKKKFRTHIAFMCLAPWEVLALLGAYF